MSSWKSAKNVINRLMNGNLKPSVFDWLIEDYYLKSLKNWLEELFLKHNKELIDWRAGPRKPGFWWYIL